MLARCTARALCYGSCCSKYLRAASAARGWVQNLLAVGSGRVGSAYEYRGLGRDGLTPHIRDGRRASVHVDSFRGERRRDGPG